jgi:hypothetical protein
MTQQSFSLILSQTTPHAIRLTSFECPLSTGRPDRTASTDLFGGRIPRHPSSTPLTFGMKKQTGVSITTSGGILPGHSFGGRSVEFLGHDSKLLLAHGTT